MTASAETSALDIRCTT